MLSPEHSIVITVIGDLDASFLKQIRPEINRVFGCNTELIPLLQDVDFAFDAGRNQYHSTPILKALAGKAPPHAVKVLAVVEVDLFIPILTHVYGEAQLGGKACIISTHRLKEGLSPASCLEIFSSRIAKEAIHELGHTFGLRHCRDHACIMHYCRNVIDVDRKSDQLCRYCKVLLEDEMKRLSRI